MNINIETTGKRTDYEYPLNTVYTAEFDYNFKILICHTYNESVIEAFTNFIRSTLNDSNDNTVKQAISNSSTVTLDIIYIQKSENIIGFSNTRILNELLFQKFSFIYRLKAYAPYGLNNLNYIIEHGKFKERALARKLIKELKQENYEPHGARGPKPFPIYKYDTKTGLLLESFNSNSEAAAANEILTGSIYQCLEKKKKTAGGYVWSKEKYDKISTEIDDKIKSLRKRTQDNLQNLYKEHKELLNN